MPARAGRFRAPSGDGGARRRPLAGPLLRGPSPLRGSWAKRRAVAAGAHRARGGDGGRLGASALAPLARERGAAAAHRAPASRPRGDRAAGGGRRWLRRTPHRRDQRGQSLVRAGPAGLEARGRRRDRRQRGGGAFEPTGAAATGRSFAAALGRRPRPCVRRGHARGRRRPADDRRRGVARPLGAPRDPTALGGGALRLQPFASAGRRLPAAAGAGTTSGAPHHRAGAGTRRGANRPCDVGAPRRPRRPAGAGGAQPSGRRRARLVAAGVRRGRSTGCARTGTTGRAAGRAAHPPRNAAASDARVPKHARRAPRGCRGEGARRHRGSAPRRAQRGGCRRPRRAHRSGVPAGRVPGCRREHPALGRSRHGQRAAHGHSRAGRNWRLPALARPRAGGRATPHLGGVRTGRAPRGSRWTWRPSPER